jgi:hypothetical protein
VSAMRTMFTAYLVLTLAGLGLYIAVGIAHL